MILVAKRGRTITTLLYQQGSGGPIPFQCGHGTERNKEGTSSGSPQSNSGNHFYARRNRYTQQGKGEIHSKRRGISIPLFMLIKFNHYPTPPHFHCHHRNPIARNNTNAASSLRTLDSVRLSYETCLMKPVKVHTIQTPWFTHDFPMILLGFVA